MESIPRAGVPPRAGHRVLSLIGRGITRACYVHPTDPGSCVKIGHARRGRVQSAREQRYLELLARRYPDDDLAHVARGRGRLSTSHGTGHVFERVMDEAPTGAPTLSPTPSPTLLLALDAAALRAERSTWEAALGEFRAWARTTAVVLRDLTPPNVCAKRLADGALRLVVVDGIGPRGTVPRLLPTLAYAHRRNAASLGTYGFDTPDTLAERCDRYRAPAVPGAAGAPDDAAR